MILQVPDVGITTDDMPEGITAATHYESAKFDDQNKITIIINSLLSRELASDEM